MDKTEAIFMAEKITEITDKYEIEFIREIRDQFANSPQATYSKLELIMLFDRLASMMEATKAKSEKGDK
jgi:hypothetical protein